MLFIFLCLRNAHSRQSIVKISGMGDPCDEDWDEDLDLFDEAPTSSGTGSGTRALSSGESFDEPAPLVSQTGGLSIVLRAIL